MTGPKTGGRSDHLQTEENVRRFGRVLNSTYPTVDYCDQFFVTLHYPENPIRIESEPLRRVEISHDSTRGCLLLEVYPL